MVEEVVEVHLPSVVAKAVEVEVQQKTKEVAGDAEARQKTKAAMEEVEVDQRQRMAEALVD